MWGELFRRILHDLVSPAAAEGLNSRAEVFFWLGRELVWWWLIAGLAAFAVSYLWRLPLAQDAIARIPRGIINWPNAKGAPYPPRAQLPQPARE
jgi:hypothetical protein